MRPSPPAPPHTARCAARGCRARRGTSAPAPAHRRRVRAPAAPAAASRTARPTGSAECSSLALARGLRRRCDSRCPPGTVGHNARRRRCRSSTTRRTRLGRRSTRARPARRRAGAAGRAAKSRKQFCWQLSRRSFRAAAMIPPAESLNQLRRPRLKACSTPL